MAKPFSLLIIDDDPGMRMLMGRILEKAGHTVTACATAEEAFILLKRRRFDLVTSDVRLPGMDGFALLKKIGRRPPVIMVTAYEEFGLRAQAIRAGAVDFLLKGGGMVTELPERVSKSLICLQSCRPAPP